MVKQKASTPDDFPISRPKLNRHRQEQIEVVWEPVGDQDAGELLLRAFEMIFTDDAICFSKGQVDKTAPKRKVRK